MRFVSRLSRTVVVLLLICGASTVWGQTTGSITGTVHDSSGAVIANAPVTVSNESKGFTRTTPTNSAGEYLVAGLSQGTYDVTVTAEGFKKYQAKGVNLDVAEKARIDIALEVGAASVEVTVVGSAVAQVETQSSDLAGTVSGKEISQLQLNGRNFTQLVTLVPGVSNQTGQDEGQVGIAGSVAFSVNGGRVEYNNWELDGGDNMDNGSNTSLNVYPNLDAIAEFKVLTSNYGAQYGRSGSGTVEVETKSGASAFHGDIFEFVRNDKFNANYYFADKSVPKPGYKKNDFGYTIGGPVYIPGHYNADKQKTFFFWSQEWRRDRVPFGYHSLVPTNAERNGDFSALCVASPADCPIDPATGNPFLGNQVPFNAADPNVQGLLSLIPAPSAGQDIPGQAFFNGTVGTPVNWREELVRLDHNLSQKNRVMFHYIHDSWAKTTETPLWTNGTSFPTSRTQFSGPGVSLLARLSSTLSPTLLNEFVVSYTTDHIVLQDVGNYKRLPGSNFGDLFGGNGGGILPGINLVGGNAYGGGFAQDVGYIPNGPYNSNPTYTYRDTVSKSVGKHNLAFGAYFVAAQKNEFGGELGAGSTPGFLTFDASNANVSTKNPFADLLLGYISSFGQQDKKVKYYNRYKIFEPYFQDDWHVSNHLTLNLGLRVSMFGTYRDRLHQAFNFDPARYIQGQTTVDPNTGIVSGLGTDPAQPVSLTNLPNGIVRCGSTAGVPISCMQGHLFNPAPRVGFAFDPFGDGKWAVRGGYGIFFEHTNGNEANTESLENSPPLANTVQQNNIVGYTNIGGGGGGLSPQFPLSVVQVPKKAIWPYMQQYHLDVQHEILRSTVATVSYVGSKGTHLTRQGNTNQLLPVPNSLNPYKPGETINGHDPSGAIHDDCGTGTTPSGVAVTGIALVNLNIACGGSADPFRPYQGYGTITHLEDMASSSYNALQVAVRRSVGGLELNFAYTYSHSIDDSSDRGDSTFVDSYNPSSNRGSSNFDQRHILNFGYVWDLPFFKGKDLKGKFLGGWQYSGVMDINTGTPFSVVYANDNAGVANGVGAGSRPDIATTPYGTATQATGFGPLFYNVHTFAPPRGLTFGNAGRNVLRNPRQTNFDMSLFKHFLFGESKALEFRFEAFNVFNHPEWGNIGTTTLNVPSAGDPLPAGYFQVNSAHGARIVQLGAKLIF